MPLPTNPCPLTATLAATTTTKAGWNLARGLNHLWAAGRLEALMTQLPSFWGCRHTRPHRPTTAFQSLCQTVTGQSVSGASAAAAFGKLCRLCNDEVTPQTLDKFVQQQEGDGTERLRQAVGLTRGKATALVELTRRFCNGQLSEDFLATGTDESVRKALLQVPGIGPWSVDVFMIFWLERSDILPLGDLGVRKGISQTFGLRGSLKKGELCGKKDRELILACLAPYRPYRSLVSMYMWKAADMEGGIKQVNLSKISKKKNTTDKNESTKVEERQQPKAVTPPRPNAPSRKRKHVSVTPTQQIVSRSSSLRSRKSPRRRVVTP